MKENELIFREITKLFFLNPGTSVDYPKFSLTRLAKIMNPLAGIKISFFFNDINISDINIFGSI